MHSWQWRTWEGLPYLTISLLEPWTHGFFTSPFWPRSYEDLTEILHSEADAYRLKQVHGNTVLTPENIASQLKKSEEFLEGDGLVSNQPLQALWVASADCTPVLIANEKTGQVAAVHAGWRGTAKKIVPQAIAQMQLHGSKLEDLRIAMGPAISGEVYQVSEQVAAEIGKSIISHDNEKFIVDALHELPNSPLLPDSEPGRVRLDVRRVNSLQLEMLGISTEQIAIAPYCTYNSTEHFFSYRREKQKKVQWSGIVSK